MIHFQMLHGAHDPRLVALSIVIAVVASYAALNLAGRVHHASGRARRLWLSAGALAMGFGIWSMHFVGMLALRLEMPVAYDLPLTCVSVLPAILASALALRLAGGSTLERRPLLFGALAMGGGITAMHYTGMQAMVMPARIHYDPALFVLSVAIAVGASYGALTLSFRFGRRRIRAYDWKQGLAALVMGAAVSGMHYTGMWAAHFEPLPGPRPPVSGLDPTTLAMLVAAITLMAIGVTVLASLIDQRMALQSRMHARALQRANNALERRVRERTAELGRANSALQADILARRQAEKALQEAKERAQVTLHAIADAVITTDAHGVVDYLNPAAERLTGWSTQAAHGRNGSEIYRLLDADGRHEIENPVSRCLREGAGVYGSGHRVLVTRAGVELMVEDSAAPIRDGGDHIIGVVVVFRDVTEQSRMAEQLVYQATHDPLTGLLNRTEFERRIDEAAVRARRDGRLYALAYLDLDQFKVVNDTCGHIAGDELLRQLSFVLVERIRDSDSLARLGGDEFGILFGDCTLEEAGALAEGVRNAVRSYRFAWREQSFEVGVSIGLVAIDAASPGTGELLSAADVACYTAKDTGRNRVHLYHADDSELAQRHGQMHLISRITRALQEDRFLLHLQPIMPIGGSAKPYHYEVLVRLAGEDGKPIPPGAFIPAAERYSLMGSIDRWVVRNAFAQLADHFGSQGADDECVFAINLSGASMSDDTLLDFIEAELARHAVPPSTICFEITETAAIGNLARASRFLRQLKRIGCRFALDDFGAGLSSFAYLKNLPVDYLKIDGGFIRDLVDTPMDRTIVEAIVRVAQVLGIETIAEFVENDRQLELLEEIGVDFAQGYLIDQPRPIERVLGAAREACRACD